MAKSKNALHVGDGKRLFFRNRKIIKIFKGMYDVHSLLFFAKEACVIIQFCGGAPLAQLVECRTMF